MSKIDYFFHHVSCGHSRHSASRMQRSWHWFWSQALYTACPAWTSFNPGSSKGVLFAIYCHAKSLLSTYPINWWHDSSLKILSLLLRQLCFL